MTLPASPVIDFLLGGSQGLAGWGCWEWKDIMSDEAEERKPSVSDTDLKVEA